MLNTRKAETGLFYDDKNMVVRIHSLAGILDIKR